MTKKETLDPSTKSILHPNLPQSATLLIRIVLAEATATQRAATRIKYFIVLVSATTVRNKGVDTRLLSRPLYSVQTVTFLDYHPVSGANRKDGTYL